MGLFLLCRKWPRFLGLSLRREHKFVLCKKCKHAFLVCSINAPDLDRLKKSSLSSIAHGHIAYPWSTWDICERSPLFLKRSGLFALFSSQKPNTKRKGLLFPSKRSLISDYILYIILPAQISSQKVRAGRLGDAHFSWASLWIIFRFRKFLSICILFFFSTQTGTDSPSNTKNHLFVGIPKNVCWYIRYSVFQKNVLSKQQREFREKPTDFNTRTDILKIQNFSCARLPFLNYIFRKARAMFFVSPCRVSW